MCARSLYVFEHDSTFVKLSQIRETTNFSNIHIIEPSPYAQRCKGAAVN